MGSTGFPTVFSPCPLTTTGTRILDVRLHQGGLDRREAPTVDARYGIDQFTMTELRFDAS
ncbi:hypothetical protein ACWGSK_20650 [Nocardiopsis sp. NPDC055551]